MTNLLKDKASAGDPIPAKCAVIEVHVGELRQLFDAIDPSPFRDRDLDPKAEDFIVGWAKDLPRDASLAFHESRLAKQQPRRVNLPRDRGPQPMQAMRHGAGPWPSLR